jgi:hypothetical protein
MEDLDISNLVKAAAPEKSAILPITKLTAQLVALDGWKTYGHVVLELV